MPIGDAVSALRVIQFRQHCFRILRQHRHNPEQLQKSRTVIPIDENVHEDEADVFFELLSGPPYNLDPQQCVRVSIPDNDRRVGYKPPSRILTGRASRRCLRPELPNDSALLRADRWHLMFGPCCDRKSSELPSPLS